MPKLKTKRGAAKRFKPNGSGRFKRMRRYRRHYLTGKSMQRKRHLRTPDAYVSAENEPQVRAMLPYA